MGLLQIRMYAWRESPALDSQICYRPKYEAFTQIFRFYLMVEGTAFLKVFRPNALRTMNWPNQISAYKKGLLVRLHQFPRCKPVRCIHKVV